MGAGISSEMIHQIATNTSNSYYLSKSFMCYITLFYYCICSKCPPAQTQVDWRWATRQQHVQ